jgi:RimJ/RimL family protein N-acetyltransferase
MEHTTNLTLIEIEHDGTLPHIIELAELPRSMVEAMLGVYEKTGFNPPWIGYIAVNNSQIVGTCAFKSSPVDGRVEIAYFTFPGYEGKGIATAMATELVRIAGQENDVLIVFAQTLPEENASTVILKKLGFRFVGPVEHPEDGTVWEWELH